MLETGLLFGGSDGGVLESPEEMTRVAFDPMRWSAGHGRDASRSERLCAHGGRNTGILL